MRSGEGVWEQCARGRGIIGNALWLLLALWMVSCSNDPYDPDSLPNQPPVARVFVSAPVDSINPTSYNRRTFYWSATDADGYVSGFHLAIAEGLTAPTNWIFTTQDESTTTYRTDDGGRAAPTVYVVAQDDDGALSDTVSTTFPLINFPPVLEFDPDFNPPKQSFGAASFDFLGFDFDGDDTLLPYVDYRFEGSDPNVVFEPGDEQADPSLGWVRLERSPTSFSLQLRDIPPGDPNVNWEQALYVRIIDEADATSDFSFTWQVFEVRGEVLLVDDNIAQTSRDRFYREAMAAHFGDQWSVWDIADGLPERDADIRLTIEQFPLLVWFTGNGASANLNRVQNLLNEYVSVDIDPDTPGVQHGRLLLENTAVVGPGSNVSSTFRAQTLGVGNNADPRNALATYSGAVEAALGPLDILPQDSSLPELVSVGQNYDGGSGRYFGLYGLSPNNGTAPLWRFESYTWGGPADPTCRLGCEPIVATRRPDTGRATVVLLAFQLEYANAQGNASDGLSALLEQHLGYPRMNAKGAR